MDSVLDAPNFSDTSTIPQATAATLPCRAGLEVEFHQIKLTFLKRNTPGTRVLWPVPVKDKGVPEKRLEETMIPGETILEPMHKDSFLLQGTTDKVNWEGDWGLKGVGAAFGQIYISPVNETMTVKTEGQPEKTIPAKYAGGSCIIELTTAAHAIDDYPFVWSPLLPFQPLLFSVSPFRFHH